MRKFALLLLMMFGAGLFFSGCAKVEPGYVGIKVNQYGSQKGVQDFPLQTGMVTFNPLTTDIYKFPTYLQIRHWTKNPNEGAPVDESITFNSIKGIPVNCDLQVSTQFDPEKIPVLFVEFRKDADYIIDVYVRGVVRKYFASYGGQMEVIDIVGPKKAELETQVRDAVNKELACKGISIDQLSIQGQVRLDDKVQEALNNVFTAQQNAQAAVAKVAQIQAEAQQKIAEAKGQAEAQRLLRVSIDGALLKKLAIEKWDGHFPQVIGSSALPFIDLKGLRDSVPPAATKDDSSDSQ